MLVAVGRIPNSDGLDLSRTGVEVDDDGVIVVDDHQRTTADGIWALGDIANHYQLKHVSNHEARVVQHNLLHRDDPAAMLTSNHHAVPSAVFSDPQVGTVGLTERDALAQGVAYVTARQDYARHRLRLGDGGHHQLRQAARRPDDRTHPRRALPRPAGVQPGPAHHLGDGVRADGPRGGPGAVLDPPGPDGGRREPPARPSERSQDRRLDQHVSHRVEVRVQVVPAGDHASVPAHRQPVGPVLEHRDAVVEPRPREVASTRTAPSGPSRTAPPPCRSGRRPRRPARRWRSASCGPAGCGSVSRPPG